MADEKYLGSERVQELWTAILTKLAGKVDLATLEGYATPDTVATAITSALSDYAKNSYVQTEIAVALADYMKESEVNDKIAQAIASAGIITYRTEDALPDTGDLNVIYLVPAESSEEKNAKDEYMWIDGQWEKIGSTTVNLSDYWSKTELQAMSSAELQEILK